MRNTLIVVLAGSVLCGCLDSGTSGFHEENEAAAEQPTNVSPIIGGSPPSTILVNEMYEFEPTAAETGRLYGQPTLDNLGIYDGIVISVSDGSASRSLPEFAIAVTQTALGKVTLSWVAPTQNADGSPLLDLAGYKIHYGKSSGIYDHEISIDNPSITTYVVDNLVPDTYYFSATSFNTSGVESEYSGEAVRTVN
jgi:hypothetical protein